LKKLSARMKKPRVIFGSQDSRNAVLSGEEFWLDA
jgi:hypothetical protein